MPGRECVWEIPILDKIKIKNRKENNMENIYITRLASLRKVMSEKGVDYYMGKELKEGNM